MDGKAYVFDEVMGSKAKTVWGKGGKFYARCGSGTVEVKMERPGFFEAIPGTYRPKPKSKQLKDWQRRALARMAA